MKLYWSPRSRASRVAWMLEEAGLDFDCVTVDLRDPEAQRDPGFIAASPLLKVPALEDGAVRMADSAAICLYLADRYPMRTLAPAFDDPQRGTYLFWMTFAPGAIEPAVNEKVVGADANPKGNAWGDFDLMIEVLEQGLQPGPWLLGDRFTAADVMVGGSVAIMNGLGVLPPSGILRDYLGRCVERRAFQAALALEVTGPSGQTVGISGLRSRRGGPHGRRRALR